jgi:hypothetical protein
MPHCHHCRRRRRRRHRHHLLLIVCNLQPPQHQSLHALNARFPSFSRRYKVVATQSATITTTCRLDSNNMLMRKCLKLCQCRNTHTQLPVTRCATSCMNCNRCLSLANHTNHLHLTVYLLLFQPDPPTTSLPTPHTTPATYTSCCNRFDNQHCQCIATTIDHQQHGCSSLCQSLCA